MRAHIYFCRHAQANGMTNVLDQTILDSSELFQATKDKVFLEVSGCK